MTTDQLASTTDSPESGREPGEGFESLTDQHEKKQRLAAMKTSQGG